MTLDELNAISRRAGGLRSDKERVASAAKTLAARRNGRIFAADRENLTIAHVARSADGDYSPANGDVLAAAPDLLSALIEIRAYLSKCPPHAEDKTGAKWGRVMDLSGAALNRAEGES